MTRKKEVPIIHEKKDRRRNWENDIMSSLGKDFLTIQSNAFALEKEGEYEKALNLYWKLINLECDVGFPYNRVRIISVKQKDWNQAINVCNKYIDLDYNTPGHDRAYKKFKKYIEKYRGKLGIGETTSPNCKKILNEAIENASPLSKQRFKKRLPIMKLTPPTPLSILSPINLTTINVPELQNYYPAIGSLSSNQIKFYNTWLKEWKNGNPIDVKGNISYLFIYSYDLIADVEKNTKKTLNEFKTLQRVYENEVKFAEYMSIWINDVLLLESNYKDSIAYLQAQIYKNQYSLASARINLYLLLSLKYRVGFPISGYDVYYLSNKKLRKPILKKIDLIIDFLEETIRETENNYGIDLLSLITEQFAFQQSSKWYLFRGFPSAAFKPKNINFYYYSELDDFKIVIDEWMKEAENIVRDSLGLPRIGEGWISETLLFEIIKQLCEAYGYEVIHHSYPPFLGRQELDIHIPSLNLGIEYQGIQHYEPINLFGGIDGLSERKKLDIRKKKLCRDHGIRLIEFRYDEPLEKDYVWNRIKRFFPDNER